MATANRTTRPYAHVSPRNYTHILKAKQRHDYQARKAAGLVQEQPVVKPVATPPSNPMSAEKKAQLDALFAQWEAQREAA